MFQLASLTDVAWQMSGEVVLMTLVGGMGTVFGPIVGAAIIITMQNYLAGFGEWVLVIQGAIFVVTVLLFRRGVAGEIAALSAVHATAPHVGAATLSRHGRPAAAGRIAARPAQPAFAPAGTRTGIAALALPIEVARPTPRPEITHRAAGATLRIFVNLLARFSLDVGA